MKFDQLFRGSMPKNVHLLKISSPLQFAAKMWALQVLISPYKPFQCCVRSFSLEQAQN